MEGPGHPVGGSTTVSLYYSASDITTEGPNIEAHVPVTVSSTKQYGDKKKYS